MRLLCTADKTMLKEHIEADLQYQTGRLNHLQEEKKNATGEYLTRITMQEERVGGAIKCLENIRYKFGL